MAAVSRFTPGGRDPQLQAESVREQQRQSEMKQGSTHTFTRMPTILAPGGCHPSRLEACSSGVIAPP